MPRRQRSSKLLENKPTVLSDIRLGEAVSAVGLAFGLERLQTEVGCLLILAGHRPMLDPEEHVESRWWPFSAAGLSAALEELGPDQLVPAAAGTLELARWRLDSW